MLKARRQHQNQEASRCRSQAGQTAGEAGIGAAAKKEKKLSQERKGQDGKGEEVKLTNEQLGCRNEEE
jgi:hypothetical protein